MSNTKIYFIRHGEVENPQKIFYGRSIDVLLSSVGEKQIFQLGKKILQKDDRITTLYSSPLFRTRQTAQILSEQLNNIPIILDERLLEVYSKGIEGKPITFLTNIGDYYLSTPEKVVIESPKDIIERGYGLVKDIVYKHKGESVGIVSHGDVLAFLIWRLTNGRGEIPSITKLNDVYLNKGNCWRLEIDENLRLVKKELITFKDI